MNFKLWHRIAATIVFLVSTVVFLMTVAPTVSFWDCGEFITSAITMAVPHPPGAPFFQLIGRVFTLLPTAEDLALRMNLVSSFSSSLTVLFAYLIIMRLLRHVWGEPDAAPRALTMILSAATGALTLAFSDTFWFNASEAEVYAIGMFFISIVVWIGLEWYTGSGMFKSDRSLLLVAYLMGLSIGVHLLSLLALFFVFVLMFLRGRRREQFTLKSVVLFLAAIAAGFAIVYPGIVQYVPKLLSSDLGAFFIVALFGVLIWLVTRKEVLSQLRLAALAILLVTLGYSTYTLIIIRANDAPAMNENNPRDLATLTKYLTREQYGGYPLLKGFNYNQETGDIDNASTGRERLFPRRWNPEHVSSYAKYTSDTDYFLRFQLGHIYLRYFLWNFVGRAGDKQDAPVALFSASGEWSESSGYPNLYYAIPLLLGLLGMFFHFRKEWKTGTALGVLFLITGFGLVVYFNMVDPQVRERDYFFIASFFAFTLWVGVGVFALADLLRRKAPKLETAGIGIAVAALLVGPGNMLGENYQTQTRHLNFVAFDYAYNLLQSCDQDAILFTGGDNDTFPLWYLQYAAGVRRDIRIVNLSLVNTSWYALQLKNERPYGAKKVRFTMTSDQMESMERDIAEARGAFRMDSPNITIPVDTAHFPFNGTRELPAIIKQGPCPTSFTFVANTGLKDQKTGDVYARNQHKLIIDILKNNLSDRPIYFSLSTAPQDRIGLDNHLLAEGFAGRVMPYTFPHSQDYYPGVSTYNIPATYEHLMQIAAVPDSNRARGYRFRELNNPDINLDEASSRMIYSFRALYLSLAQAIVNETGDKKAATAVLDKMSALFPPTVQRMDENISLGVCRLYYQMGAQDRVRSMAATIQPMLRAQFDKYEATVTTMDGTIESINEARDNMIRYAGGMLELARMSGDSRSGLALIAELQRKYPGDKEMQGNLAYWAQQLSGPAETAPAPAGNDTAKNRTPPAGGDTAKK